MGKWYLLKEDGYRLLLEDGAGTLLESTWGYRPLKITVNSTDRTSSIPVDTVRIANVLGKQIDTASFVVENGGVMGLAELQEVIISSLDGGTQYFAGYIFSLAEHSRGPLLDYEIECIDYSWDMEHPETLVDGTFASKSDQWIIQNEVATCIPDIDCTTYVEEVLADTVSIEFDQETPRRVLDRLAKLAGAEWYVDYGPGPGGKNACLHYFDAGTNTAPFSLSDAPNLATSFPYDRGSLVKLTEAPSANKVIVIGVGTVTATRTRGAEGDYGRWLIAVLKDNNLTTTAQAEAAGDAFLLAAAAAPSYSLVTRQVGLRSGQDVTLVNAARSLDAAFEIKKVTTRFLGNGYARFDVECGKYIAGLSDFWRGMAAPVDTTPATPTTPTDSIATVTDDRGNQTGSLRLDWAANAELDLSGYQVEALLTGETRWRTQRVTASDAVFEGFPLGSTVRARVKAVDLGGNESAYLNFNSANAITMPTDTTAPALTTNPPTVTAVKKGVKIEFTKPTEQDWSHTLFYCDTSNPPTTLVNSDKTTAYTHPTTSYSLHYARYKHVDEAGNESAYSSVASATPEQTGTTDITDAAITTAKINSLAVTTAKINNLAVTSAKIDSLDCAKLTAGTITAAVSISTMGTLEFVSGPILSGSGDDLICDESIYATGFISTVDGFFTNTYGQICTNLGVITGLRVRSDNELALKDGMTAPTASAGYAKIYVDSADGDLKIIFADSTVKTIVVDT